MVNEVVASVAAQYGRPEMENIAKPQSGKALWVSKIGKSAAQSASISEFRQLGPQPRRALHQLGLFHAFRSQRDSNEPEWAARKKTPAVSSPRNAPTEFRSGIGEVMLSSGETSGMMKVNGRLMAQLVSPGAMWRYGQGYRPLGMGIA